VVYVDSFRNTYKFHENNEVHNFIEENKEYSQASTHVFHQQNYCSDLAEERDSFDLIISQYGGFV
jgi:hypothetical protein